MSVKFEPLAARGVGLAKITVTYVALSYGIALLTPAWVLYRVSGGLFNPAITLDMVLAGALPPLRGLILFPAQLLGAICAAAVVSCIAPIDIDMVQNKLAPETSVAQGVFLEMVCTIVAITVKQCWQCNVQFLTAYLTLTVLMLAAENRKTLSLHQTALALCFSSSVLQMSTILERRSTQHAV
jgi:aquaporin related protein